MKPIIIVIIYFSISFYSFAEIKNGYKKDLNKAEQTLKNLKIVLDEVYENEEKFSSVKTRYILVNGEFNMLKKFFILTNELIFSLQMIHPDLFNEINGIQDHHGNETDVYIRVQSEDDMYKLHWATTNLQHVVGDPHTYKSCYGKRTVSINIRQCPRKMILKLLVHELGHVKYQVPNLAIYIKYFIVNYRYSKYGDMKGHKNDDPSNQSVIAELKRFGFIYRERKHLLKNQQSNKAALKTSVLNAVYDSELKDIN